MTQKDKQPLAWMKGLPFADKSSRCAGAHSRFERGPSGETTWSREGCSEGGAWL